MTIYTCILQVYIEYVYTYHTHIYSSHYTPHILCRLSHRSQALASTMTVSKKGSGRKGSSGTGGEDDDVFDEDGMGTTEDMGAAKVFVYVYAHLQYTLLYMWCDMM